MGTVLSYFTGKLSSSRIETDPFEEMAQSRHHTTVVSMSQNNITRYMSAFQVVQEFLDNGGSIMERQRMLESELETCHERLRRFTEDHARVSETGNENISSSNRPSTLEGKYKQFYDHERVDAIDCIESSRINKERSKWNEADDQYVACMIFEESFTAAQKLREGFLQGVSCILTSAPSIGAQFLEKKTNNSTSANVCFSVKTDSNCQLSSLGQSSVNSLKVIMKETAETCDINALVQRTLNALHKRQEKGVFQVYSVDFLTKKPIIKYVENCCRYAWKLVCQTPPYRLQGNSFVLKSDVVFDPVFHQVSREFASAEHNSGRIEFVVWPGLFEGSSGRVIRKTEVVLRAR
ncbi:uncharacterized protein LOC110044772 isoform X1 [Orbicella faveolata]|uniref:uncharacterized protein LOC110044772 isoform X1 n=1 Tax=Orbicella faveolata TaxID=48498 RepID=UPI0009E4EE6A|nr:uncharacterized protein LOC110044772 isoform X1 [Orbicella faveolata]